MSSRLQSHRVGAVFSALTLGGTAATAVGAFFAYTRNAPIWAFLLFADALLVNIPLGGIVGYLFRGPQSGQSKQDMK